MMETNQTVQLKPIYSHSQVSICSAPAAISATIPNLALSSTTTTAAAATGVLSIVETNNGSGQVSQASNNDNLNTLQSIPATLNKSSLAITQAVPMAASGVCLNNLQIQQLQMHHQQTFSQNHQTLQVQYSNRNGDLQQHLQPQQLVQIHIATPSTLSSSSMSSSMASNGDDSTIMQGNSGMVSHESIQVVNRSSIVSDSSNLSSGSSKSNISEMISINNNSNNNNNGNNNDAMHSIATSSGSHQGDTISHDNSAISMKLDSSFSNSIKSNGRGKGFKCQVCFRTFTQKGNLKTHLMTHSGERPYECQTCGKNFTQKGNLDTHVKIHTATKDHKCQYCDRGFTQRGNLKTHIRSIHTKEKPYACGHCGKPFSQKGNMLTHFRTHDKEARFPCNVCGKTFSQKGNLKTHQQRHGRNPR